MAGLATRPILLDATSQDPTGTNQLRASFRAQAKLRLRQLRAQMRTAVTEQDLLGLGQGTIMGFHPTGVRLTAFHAWLAYMAGHYLAGSWPDRFIDQAWESGRQVAVTEVHSRGSVPPHTPGHPQHLAQLAKQELDGIIAATVQQVSRAAADVLQRRLKLAPAWRLLAAAFDKVSLNRLMALCNVLVIAAFNQAKLETYRDAGLSEVGIIPETEAAPPTEKKRPSVLGGVLKTAAALALLKGAFGEPTPAELEGGLSAARARQVGVQTAGDERVCIHCDEIAAGSPYAIDKVPVIPAHPNCRCAVFAWR